MARYAIGDVQGCHDELRTLLARLRFSPDRDRLWFVGDLVNRGPRSLEVLRFVRSLGAAAIVVLGNHDLHLLALGHGARRKAKSGDTLDAVLGAPDREALLEWLGKQPMLHYDATHGDLLVHAGLVPQWNVAAALTLATEIQARLRTDPRTLLEQMYGDQPDRWSEALAGIERVRFGINALTRMRVCTADGRIDVGMKGPPQAAPPPFRPWFEYPRASAGTRIVFGHWSALGYVDRNGVLGLDTGCVWGGSLTAFDLDSRGPPVSVACSGYQQP